MELPFGGGGYYPVNKSFGNLENQIFCPGGQWRTRLNESLIYAFQDATSI